MQAVETEEDRVIIRDGELLTGILDKKQFGAKPYGLVHACFEVYGPDVAGKLLSCLGRLFTRFNQYFGFTCRMDDLVVLVSNYTVFATLTYFLRLMLINIVVVVSKKRCLKAVKF
jgi:hypothetical protein